MKSLSARIICAAALLAAAAVVCVRLATAQHQTVNVNGTIGLTEYGTNNSVVSGGQTWYMTWDETNLYVGLRNANTSEGAVIYIDRHAVTTGAGTYANGNTAGQTYDNTNFASLPFRADFVAYFKDGYREYRTADGAGNWSAPTTAFGSYASTAGSDREVAIPWSAVTGGARPAQFNFFAYATSPGGIVYGQAPPENPGGLIGTSATYTRFYRVADTDNGESTKPFTLSFSTPRAFVVNSTADTADAAPGDNSCDAGGGVCTLRAALQEAAAVASIDAVNFQIPAATDPGCNPGTLICTIAPLSPLPPVADPAVIDGYTQPGAAANTLAIGDDAALKIELNGAGAGAGAEGLTITGGTTTVRGLVINRFGGRGIEIGGEDFNVVTGCFIGTDPGGTLDLGNAGDGIFIQGLVGGSNDNRIGGTLPAERNVISGNNAAGIGGAGGGSNVIQGNYVGTDRSGAAGLGNGDVGVVLAGTGSLLGGATADARNVISANGGVAGVTVSGGGHAVQGNYIGTDVSGAVDLGNTGRGINTNVASGLTIGAPAATAGQPPGNVISGNGIDGVRLGLTSASVVQGNLIGTNAAGTGALGNGGDGLELIGNTFDNQLGGSAAGARNVIAFNGGDGVLITAADGVRNPVLTNSVHTNGGQGIDLGNNDGPTPNDALDPDAGPNNLQNYPLLTSVSTSGGATTVSGALNSTPNSTFRVEFFSSQSCDASGNGEGQTFLGAKTVTTDALGNALFTSDPLPPVPVSRQVTATATVTNDPADAANVNNTSEFSQCRQELAIASTFVVNSTGDAPDADLEDGLCATGLLVGTPPVAECTLRAAIQQANANPSPDTVAFDIIVPAAGLRTIAPATPLPGVTQPATIDGYTQPGALPNTAAVGNNAVLLVELNGASAGAGADGLSVATNNATVRGLVVNRFAGDGVELSGASGQNTVAGNYIGTDSAGAADLGNTGSGVRVSNGASNTVGGSAPAERNVISGNGADGVTIVGAGTSATAVLGNYIGTDRGGTIDLGNSASGVGVSTASNQIGDATTTPGQGAGNVISGNDAHGVAINGAGANEVQGNLIGLQPDGATARPNALDGVNVTGVAAGNTIGGPAPGLRNIISSNGNDGVELNGAGVTGNTIGANYIGTSSGGTADLGNGANGVLIAGGATSNTVGGLTSSPGSSPGNIISGNNSDGVEIASSNSNTVLGNLIGLQSNGLTARRNEGNGVFISSAASNTVGGYTASARNVISAHNTSATTDGVDITNTASVNNRVVGNYIGTGVGGTETGLGNGGDGVRVAAGADNNVVGGGDDDDGAADGNVGARNVIGNNAGDGVEINGSGSTGNTVAGNYVGIDKDGVGDIGNAANGVLSSGASNTVGGPTAAPGTGAGNVISGNGADGVELSTNADSNLVRGNLIGLQPDGVSIVPNVGNGVHLTGARLCTVGGATPDLRNVISGNGANGVLVGEGETGEPDTNTIAGNYIGTDATGALDRGNTADGVHIDGGDFVTVGGGAAAPGAAPGNVISGNNSDGVELADTGGDTNTNTVAGNLVGTAADGAGALANTGDGIRISAGVTATTVGGATPDLRNVISGNGSDGVEIAGTATGNNVLGNYVGTQADGTSARPNAGNGVLIGASANAVGGAAAGAGNRIAFNGGDGVHVQSGTGNALRRNSIHSNGGLGIDLGPDGVTPNDLDDPDAGANNLQNFPLITDARTGSTLIAGTLNSTPNTTFTVEFFHSPAADPTGAGEGANFLDSISVTTDAGGDAVFTHTAPATAPLGNVITATATNPSGNTSEFSTAHVVLAATLARLREFEATVTDGGVALAWRTELEVDNLGFRLYREEAGARKLITPSLVAGSALAAGPRTVLTAGGSYAWTDAAGTVTSRYWLEDVDADGVATLHGPFWPTRGAAQARRGKKPLPSLMIEEVGAPQAAQNPQRGWATQAAAEERGAAGAGARGVNARGSTVVGPSAPEPTNAEGRQLALAGGAAVKLSVRRPGWYRVTRAQLEAAGLNPLADPVRLQLFAEGVEQAIHVNAVTWALNGAVEFYGEGLDTVSTDARVYWLVEGLTAGRRTSTPVAPVVGGGRIRPRPFGGTGSKAGRISTLPVEPQPAASEPVGGPDPHAGFDYTVERRDRTVYFAGLLNGERSNFFGSVITPTAAAQTLTVRGLRAADAGPARLEVALQGLTAGPHSVRVTLNGSEVGTLVYAGRENESASFDVSPALLLEGDNELGLVSSAPSDVSLTDYVRLTYRRAYRAEADRLSLTAEAGTSARVTGFTTDSVRVVDVTEPGSVTEVAAAVGPADEEDGGGYAVRFTPSGTGRRTLLAFGEPAVASVDEARANRPSAWSDGTNAADLVVITHADFRDAAAALAERRASEGLLTVVADVEDIFDEFSFGAHAPEALRDFLLRAFERWQRAPRYVLLVGDGSYDPRNHLGRGSSDFVPARLVDTEQLETASDEWLADFDGDGVAEMSVGRLPARTAAEAERVVAKIMGHAPAAAERRLLLVSDRRGADGFDFEAVTSSLLAHVPAGYEAVRIDRGARDAATVRAEIVGGVNSGPALVNYVGHGSVGVWTGEGLLRTADALALTNGARLPLFAMMTCLNGYYHDPSLDSLSESLLKAEHGGALAAWGSSGMTTPDAQAEMNRALYRALFESTGPLLLGDALRAARTATADADVRRTWVLLGDPTTPWR